MKYKKIPIKGYNILGMYPVYIKNLYEGHEPFKVVGIRENQVELQGDHSGEAQWFNNDDVFVVSTVCDEQLKTYGCQVPNIHCCGGGSVINKHIIYWDNLLG